MYQYNHWSESFFFSFLNFFFSSLLMFGQSICFFNLFYLPMFGKFICNYEAPQSAIPDIENIFSGNLLPYSDMINQSELFLSIEKEKKKLYWPIYGSNWNLGKKPGSHYLGFCSRRRRFWRERSERRRIA